MSTQYHNKSGRKSQSEANLDDDEKALATWAAQVAVPVWDAGLQCRVFSADYDPVRQTGTIAIEWGGSADMTGAVRKFDRPVKRVNVDWQSAYGQRRRDVSYIAADDDLDDEGDPLPIIDDEPWHMIDYRQSDNGDIEELISLCGRNIQ